MLGSSVSTFQTEATSATLILATPLYSHNICAHTLAPQRFIHAINYVDRIDPTEPISTSVSVPATALSYSSPLVGTPSSDTWQASIVSHSQSRNNQIIDLCRQEAVVACGSLGAGMYDA